MNPVDQIGDLFASEGLAGYLGEAVTQAEHMLQCARLAERSGAAAALVAAALLHDVGHFRGTLTGEDLMAGRDNHHSETGADWLAAFFGDAVTEPVRLHVDAKRYLCYREPTYYDTLSPASRYTLSVQGGPMAEAEAEAFAAAPFHEDALLLRRFDDSAKTVGADFADFDHYRALLSGLLVAR